MKVFFDSNVFLKYLAGVEEAKKLVDKVEYGEWKGYVSDIVISEVVYGYLRLALNVPKYKLREYVVEHVDKVKELLEQDVYPLFINFNHLPTSVGIDALIVATCRAHSIGDIATFDEDFKRIPWLRIVRET